MKLTAHEIETILGALRGSRSARAKRLRKKLEAPLFEGKSFAVHVWTYNIEHGGLFSVGPESLGPEWECET